MDLRPTLVRRCRTVPVAGVTLTFEDHIKQKPGIENMVSHMESRLSLELSNSTCCR